MISISVPIRSESPITVLDASASGHKVLASIKSVESGAIAVDVTVDGKEVVTAHEIIEGRWQLIVVCDKITARMSKRGSSEFPQLVIEAEPVRGK